jgi:nitrogen fixation-related uncharacterized protein
MNVISVIAIVAFCIIASVFLYGLWVVDNDRYEFRKKNGIDPKYHGWVIKDEEENDKNQNQ